MSVLSNIHEFWARFEDEQQGILQALKSGNYEQLMQILEGLDAECYAVSGAHLFVEDSWQDPELTLDAGVNKTTQLITQQMKKLAPQSVKRTWIINDVLPPLSQKAIEAQFQIKDEVYTLFDCTAFYQINEQNQSFVIHLYCPGFRLIENPEHKREMCIYLVETAVGQLCFEAYVSFVDFLDAPMDDTPFCNLTELYEVIMDTAEKEHWKDYKNPTEIYTVYQPHQDIAHDSLRKDMKIIFTTHPLLAEESLGEGKDVLLDLKAKEGEYGYIYYANLYAGKDDALLRQELSRKLEDLFAPLHCAKVIGGAIGKSYSYIDVILFDKAAFEKVFDQIKEQLSDKVDLHYRSFEQEA